MHARGGHCVSELTVLCFWMPANPPAVGRFEGVSAKFVGAGDILAVLTDETNPSAGLTAVIVEATAFEEAEGLYTPLIESPYIIADGVVVPR